MAKSKKVISGAHVVLYRILNGPGTRWENRPGDPTVRAVLLCKRTLDAPVHPGYWGLFGGMVDSAETPRTAVFREVYEELKINLPEKPLESLCDVRTERAGGTVFVSYFMCPLPLDMDELTLRRHKGRVEGEGLAWFDADEVHHLKIRPEDRIALEHFFHYHGT